MYACCWRIWPRGGRSTDTWKRSELDASIFMKSGQPWDHDQPSVPKYDAYPTGRCCPTTRPAVDCVSALSPDPSSAFNTDPIGRPDIPIKPIGWTLRRGVNV